MYKLVSKVMKLYALNLYNFLYVNHTSVKWFKRWKDFQFYLSMAIQEIIPVCVCVCEMSEYLTILVLIQDLPLKQSRSLNRFILVKHLN